MYKTSEGQVHRATIQEYPNFYGIVAGRDNHSGFQKAHKFWTVDTIGKQSTKTLMILPSLVNVAKERVGFQRG